MKRAFYMAGIIHSVYTTFEQLRLVEMELQILAHRAGLTEEQKAENERKSRPAEPGSLPPLQV